MVPSRAFCVATTLAGATGVGAGVAVLALAEAAGADAVDEVAGALPYKPPGALHAARKIGSPTIHNSRFMFCFASLNVAVSVAVSGCAGAGTGRRCRTCRR